MERPCALRCSCCSPGVALVTDVCQCWDMPLAGKTFELRRSEARDGRGKGMDARSWRQLFLGLALDRHRARVGLLPFPKAVPPPPPPSEERKQASGDSWPYPCQQHQSAAVHTRAEPPAAWLYSCMMPNC